MTFVAPIAGVGPAVALDPIIVDAVARNAWFAFNLSGGKDSSAAAFAASELLDTLGHDRQRRIAIHADLGRAEWRATPVTVAAIAQRLGLPLTVVRRGAGDMVDRWEQCFEAGKARYAALSTYHLIGPWSSASLRFCTSELKVQVIGPYLARHFRGENVVSVIGLRRAESVSRRNTEIARFDTRFARSGNPSGTRMSTWHPLVDWSAEEVFACHDRHDLPLHEAYRCHGSSRLSCAFCVLASGADLAAATREPSNLDLYRHLVSMEAASTFSFQPGRWLADVAPHALSPPLARDIAQAKRDAAARHAIEKAMPADLRFVKGWPPRLPTLDEAQLIASAREVILLRHGLDNHFPDAAAVRSRFSELLDQKSARARSSE
ncbi:phosphoadenosine phosphosulfate reductase family protein [Novosphingobium sp. LASN5T]|uniref:phosphoadenosine phosphosulfate reductase domain-containing protein n=1 Tax=Novosphingobium sp. LASN5T TaxID=2491021 RepID=UPI000F5F8F8D|nr:phosphoadenosine phosphosulfate reductase family protein [Novosphingobium sp. LASN5T]RQW46140.1 phosphoadenosine phosphosulfate reductase [Novosphingobium sp. LASN5T]